MGFRETFSPTPREFKAFLIGQFFTTILILPAAIYSNHAQKEFIALQSKVISLYKRKLDAMGALPAGQPADGIPLRGEQSAQHQDDRSVELAPNANAAVDMRGETP